MDMLLPLTAQDAVLATVGGKGANLAKLVREGFPVPDGFVLSIAAYQAFVTGNGLDRAIGAALARLEATSTAALEAASTQIRAAFAAGEMAPELRAAPVSALRDEGREHRATLRRSG